MQTYIYRWWNSWDPLPGHLRDICGPEGVVGLARIEVHGCIEGGVDAKVLEQAVFHRLPVHFQHLHLCLGWVAVWRERPLLESWVGLDELVSVW